MDSKLKKLVKNFSMTFMANIISVLISMLLILVLPKNMSVTQYGYWQLYILYSNYISFFHLGLADGYYLRNSGTLYEDLDKKQFSFMFRVLLLSILTLATLFITGYQIWAMSGAEIDTLNVFVLQMTAVAAVLILPRVFIQFAWQAGDHFKENAIIIIVERAFFLLSVALYAVKQFTDVTPLISLDLVGKLLALLLAIFWAKDFIFIKPVRPKNGFSELFKNVSAGMSLMLASITSSLIIGLIQLSIKDQWGVDTYSRISLTFSLSNLLMIFINALALVLLPHIKRQDESDNLRLQKRMREILMLLLFLMLNAYYPFRLFVNFWLPKYAEGIVYMSILFPICIFESKTQLLTNTFLKAYRKERSILKANIISLLLCVALMLGFAFAMKNLFLTTLSILIVLAFRALISEHYLAKETGLDDKRSQLIELALTAIFVLSQWFVGGIVGAVVYLLFSLVYAWLNKALLKDLFGKIKPRISR